MRAPVRPDRVYLGWQYAPLHTDPGPLPRRPSPPAAQQLSQDWADAQAREEQRLSRPARLACAAALIVCAAVAALGLAGVLNAALTSLFLAVFLAVAVMTARSVHRGRRHLAASIAAEEMRITRIRDVQMSRLAVRQEQHAEAVRTWEARRDAYERQLHWYAVSLPADIDRVDVAGGTLSGWSALLTMIAAPRLTAGGDVTVLDLTEGAVARDLLAVARRTGIEPLVWVLPGDLPKLDLGSGLEAPQLAEVLAATVAASEEPGESGAAAAPAAVDSSILERVLGALGAEPTMAQITAALRVLAQVGDPRDDLATGLLTAAQLEKVTALFGRAAADRTVLERALAIESRLRALEHLAGSPLPLPPSRLRVAWLDRRAGPGGNRVLAGFLTVALTHLLRQQPARPRWQQTLVVLGAEKLRGDVVDRLTSACESAGTGLVVCYRTIPAHVRDRLGRGNAAVAFMRLGNAQDAKAASEQIGAEHRFVVSQLTDTVGTSVTDTAGDSYTSTVGSSDSLSDSASVSDTKGSSQGRGKTRQDAFAPFGHFSGSRSNDSSSSRAVSDSRSITAGVSAGTSWGISTSRAAAMNTSQARTSQRSREFLVEQHELQQLPASAVIVSHASPRGRQVILADANPGIMTLRTATLLNLDEAIETAATTSLPPAGRRVPPAAATGARPAGPAAGAPAAGPGAPPAGGLVTQPPPNLGPPPERLDWRRQR